MGNQRYSMRWVWIDDGSGVQQTMSAVANVVRRHNADFVWGGYASGLCKFTARQAYQEGKLTLCGAAASPISDESAAKVCVACPNTCCHIAIE